MSTTPQFKLAILDDYANIANPKFSFLSSRLEIVNFPETLNSKTTSGRDALIERLKPFHIVSTMRERTVLSKEVIENLPNLKLLLTTGRRNASIDVEECEKRGIIVAGTTGPKNDSTNPSGYSITNEHTWALILGLAKNVSQDDKQVKEGGWNSGLVFKLAGKTIGLLGLGRLGSECAKTAILGFGMKIITWSNSLTQEKADEIAQQEGLSPGAYKVVGSKKELFENADILSVHYVLSKRSEGIVGEEELRRMKKNSLFINTSRGPLVNEQALLKALKERWIRGAALDVFDVEPLETESPWRTTRWGGRWYESSPANSPHGLLGREHDEFLV